MLAFIDVDETVKATYGYAKQGAGDGYTGVKGLNALIATVSSPPAAPLIVGTRLRKGSANSARGAALLVADAIRAAGAGAGGPDGSGLVILRANSAFYGYPVWRRPAGPAPGSPSPCAPARPSPGRSRASPRTPGSRSTKPTRSGTTKPSA